MSPGLFRLSLASIVVLSHLTKLAIGTAAVELFFVLSGYWIYRMYDAKYRRAANPGLVFLFSRLLRLLPMFLLFNSLALLLHFAWHDRVAAGQSLISIVPNMLVIGYASLAERPMVPGWSLDIEMQFYCLFPLIFCIVTFLGRLAPILCLVLLAAGGWYMGIVLKNDSQIVAPFTGFFLLGILTASMGWQPSARLALISSLACFVGFAGLLISPVLRGFLVHDIDGSELSWNTGLNFIAALLLTPLALFSVRGRPTQIDRILGDLSYVVYCSHWITTMIASRYLADLSRLAKLPALAALLGVTYATSLAVLIFIDRPLSRWREQWISRFTVRNDSTRTSAFRI